MSKASRGFTGWHMTAILVAFFGIVIAVNVLMATVAIETFGGTVVDNSYVASQEFNGWLARARHQARLGWRHDVTLDAQRHPVIVLRRSDGSPIEHARVNATAVHPLGRAPDIPFHFVQTGEGSYRAARALPPGRWSVTYVVRSGSDEQRLVQETQ